MEQIKVIKFDAVRDGTGSGADRKEDNYNHIIDHVYVGNMLSLDELGGVGVEIEQIISLAKPPASTHSTRILFDDVGSVDIIPYAERIYAMLETGKKTLVHCAAGRSRSCAVVLYYIMKKHHKGFQEAYDMLEMRRGYLCINEGFIQALKAVAF
jgi:protein tyrosine phosphatase